MSIKITKPRLTIDGFKVDPPEQPLERSEKKSAKSRQSRSLKRGRNDSRERMSTSEIQSKGQQSSLLNGAKGLDESIPAYSRGRSDGRAAKEAEEQEGAGQDYYEDTLDEGNGGEMEDQMDAADDEDGQE